VKQNLISPSTLPLPTPQRLSDAINLENKGGKIKSNQIVEDEKKTKINRKNFYYFFCVLISCH